MKSLVLTCELLLKKKNYLYSFFNSVRRTWVFRGVQVCQKEWVDQCWFPQPRFTWKTKTEPPWGSELKSISCCTGFLILFFMPDVQMFISFITNVAFCCLTFLTFLRFRTFFSTGNGFLWPFLLQTSSILPNSVPVCISAI